MSDNKVAVFIIALLIAGISILFFHIRNTISQGKRDKIEIIKTLELENDSLKNELEVQLRYMDRYDIAIDRFKELNPKAAEELEECFHNIE